MARLAHDIGGAAHWKRRVVLAAQAVWVSAALATEPASHDSHQQHLAAVHAPPAIQRRLVHLSMPAVELTRHDGHRTSLKQAVDVDGPVFVNFIYTSCTTVCPVMSATFAGLQARLGEGSAGVRLVSVSIDPLQDTPARLNEYRQRFHAGAEWQFLTGTVESSVLAQKAFDVYRGDKMNHPVASFFRPSAAAPWVRLEGFASPALLQAELSPVAASEAHALHAGNHHGTHH